MLAQQIEFDLAVPICAWCKPREVGDALVVLSHGICPRHLRQIKRELHRRAGAAPRRRARRTRPSSELEAELLQLSS